MLAQNILDYDSTNLDNNPITLNSTANNNPMKYDNINADIGSQIYNLSTIWRKPYSTSAINNGNAIGGGNTSASTSDLMTTSDDDSIKPR